MRLTLRTLLAYLDDTLDPEEARSIGQKVSESPVAVALIERIRKVTRRRSLASPPALGGESHLDPNIVAEFLDSVLPAEELAQVEQKCLDDDVYLAEVAACHQILTMILSEPANVPGPARQRMYRLVRGRESIPYRRPPVTLMNSESEPIESEVPGGSSSRRQIAWAAAAILLGGLVASLILSWPDEQPHRSAIVAQTPPPKSEVLAPPEQPKLAETKKPPPESEPELVGPLPAPKNDNQPSEPRAKPEAEKKPLIRLPIEPPSADRQELGTLNDPTGLLITRPVGKEVWLPIKPQGPVMSAEPIMALPGFRATVKLDTGVTVMLWGNLLEFLPLASLECQATLHRPAKGFDADLSLDRGRLVITHAKTEGLARVRLRYQGEIWDIELAEKSEAIVDGLFSLEPGTRFQPNEGSTNPPMHQLFMGVVKGNATVLIQDRDPIQLTAPPGQALLGWDNKGRLKSPVKIAEPLPQWTRDIPTKSPASDLKTLLENLRERLLGGTTAQIALTELTQQDGKPFAQVYSAYGLQAIDEIGRIVDALDDLTNPPMRAAAIPALRHWVARNARHSLTLHKMLRSDKGYTSDQADAAVQMMHSFTETDLYDRRTYEFLFQQLEDPKLAIRELAYWHLAQLDPDGARSSMYNPAADQQRDAALRRWRQRLNEGKLPPKPPKQNATPAGKSS